MKNHFFADYLERLEGLQGGLHKEVRDMAVVAMDWKPGPDMSSVAVLLARITGLLREGIDLALGAASLFPSACLAHPEDREPGRHRLERLRRCVLVHRDVRPRPGGDL